MHARYAEAYGRMAELDWKEPAVSNEELQRTMECIVHQQAQARSSIQSLVGIVRRHSTQIENLHGRMSEVTDLRQRTARLIEELDRCTEEKFQRTDERFRLTDERFQRTDERINALIALAELHLSDGRK